MRRRRNGDVKPESLVAKNSAGTVCIITADALSLGPERSGTYGRKGRGLSAGVPLRSLVTMQTVPAVLSQKGNLVLAEADVKMGT